MTKKEVAKRYGLFVVSLFFSAMGIALTRHGGLGVSPISSVANIMSYRIPDISFGTWLILWNCTMVLGQILILRKDFKPIQFLQIPLSLIFGLFTDLGVWTLSNFPPANYGFQMAFVVAGIIVIGFGVCLAVIADVIMNSGEAFVKVVADKAKKDFGKTKIVFDLSCAAASVVMSLIFFDMQVIGTREGTILTAIFTGLVVNFFRKRLQKPLVHFLVGRKRKDVPTTPLETLMKKEVYTVKGSDTIVDALKMLTEKKISGMPVVDEKQSLIGFISDGDIIRFLSDGHDGFINVYSFIKIGFDEKMKRLMNMKVMDIAKKAVITVDTDDDLEMVCSILGRKHIKKAPVMEDGAMVGIINISNITKYALKQMSMQ